ncbi:NAD-dependent deacetylase sirtuin-7 [Brachionus plicatilis]|uniref:protein acetyllysine N-acetyltransferase n=1 Tax=Brachionus plicatilis TaxID=10195 RepID=A0A3M7RWE8_BRAPC|nr:NAD-dependent deacetylase sirtuin-7 [Brachionus plicatilis]
MLKTRSGRCIKPSSDYYETISTKKQQKRLVVKIKKILKTPESVRSEDEKELIINFQDIVNNINLTEIKRINAQLHQKIVIDDEETLKIKCLELANAIKNSKKCVIYTGAGISTSASIPDYRGPNGLWTMLKKGVKIKMPEFSLVKPTYSHMALLELVNTNIVSHIVSQNCDGLHLRSGIDRSKLSELHGNCFIEFCTQCSSEYVRLFDVTENTSFRKHLTGRFCKSCPDSQLKDSIIHFGEKLRDGMPYNWESASNNVKEADLIICFGSSLKVLKHYSCLWPKKKTDLYIVNIQWTLKDKVAKLKINGYCDQVLKMVVGYLNEKFEKTLKVANYEISNDPLFKIATTLEENEYNTTNKSLLTQDPVQKEDQTENEVQGSSGWFTKCFK